MRLVVVPLSLKESMVYCQKTHLPLARAKPRIDDRMAIKANKVWSEWSKSDVKWKRSIVDWANKAMQRISYDEWSLKTIPAKSAVMRRTANDTHVTVEEIKRDQLAPKDMELISVEYAGKFVSQDAIINRLSVLTDRGLSHHKRFFWLSAIGAPLTLPVAALPVIPNIPGFYLMFRAWSHWKAFEGAKHLQYLLTDNHLSLESNAILNEVCKGLEAIDPTSAEKDRLILDHEHIDDLAEKLGAKEMGPELHRAVHQVKKRIDSQDKPS